MKKAMLIYFISVLCLTIIYVMNEQSTGREMCLTKETLYSTLNQEFKIGETLTYNDVFKEIRLFEHDYIYMNPSTTTTYHFVFNQFTLDNNLDRYGLHKINKFQYVYDYFGTEQTELIFMDNTNLVLVIEKYKIDPLNGATTIDKFYNYLETNNIYGVFERKNYLEEHYKTVNLFNINGNVNEYNTGFNMTYNFPNEVVNNQLKVYNGSSHTQGRGQRLILKPKTNYTVTFNYITNSLGNVSIIPIYYSTGTASMTLKSSVNSFNFTTTNDTNYLMTFLHNGNSNQTDYVIFYDIMILETSLYDDYINITNYIDKNKTILVERAYRNAFKKTQIVYNDETLENNCISPTEIGKVAFRDGLIGFIPKQTETGMVTFPIIDLYAKTYSNIVKMIIEPIGNLIKQSLPLPLRLLFGLKG